MVRWPHPEILKNQSLNHFRSKSLLDWKGKNMRVQENKIRIAASSTMLVATITGALAQGGCSGTTSQGDATILLGDEILNYSSSMNGSGDEERLWLANDSTGKIYSISVSRFEIEREFKISGCESIAGKRRIGFTRVIGGGRGKFAIAVGLEGYCILRADGSMDQTPVPLQGEIAQQAYSELPAGAGSSGPDSILVLSDTIGSLALLRISADGQLLAHALAGSLIPGTDEQIQSVTVMSGRDTLLTRTSNGNFYRAGISKALATGELEFAPVTLPSGMAIESILPLRGQQSRILVREKERISILDVDSMMIVEQIALDPSLEFVGESRGRWPHMAFVASDPGSLVHVVMAGPSGKLSIHRLSKISGFPTRSYISETGDNLTVVTGSRGYAASGWQPPAVYQVRLKDSLVTGRSTIEFGSIFALTERYIFNVKPSIFGLISRTEIARPENSTRLEWFNLDDALKLKNGQ